MKLIRKGLLQQFDRDEAGTSLTEFAIILPIFLMLLNFMLYMGAAGNTLTYEWNDAQRQLWSEVRTGQQLGHEGIQSGAPGQHNTQPAAAATHATAHLTNYSSSKQIESLGTAVDSHETGTYSAMGSNGHWGESDSRAAPVANQVPVFVDGNRSHTNNPSDVIGGSRFAETLVDDGSGAQTIDYEINSGIPAVLGAGIRYGVAHVVREVTYDFPHGESFNVKAEYNLLVPPRPPHNAELWAMEVIRPQLDNYSPYSDMLGIDHEQPLSEEGAPGVPELWSTPDN